MLGCIVWNVRRVVLGAPWGNHGRRRVFATVLATVLWAACAAVFADGSFMGRSGWPIVIVASVIILTIMAAVARVGFPYIKRCGLFAGIVALSCTLLALLLGPTRGAEHYILSQSVAFGIGYGLMSLAYAYRHGIEDWRRKFHQRRDGAPAKPGAS